MDTIGKEKIDQIIKLRKKANSYYSKRSKVFRSFLEMEKAAFSGGALEKKYKELIAIGISVVINCESCMEWHIRQAIDNGASQDEILEAVGVGIEMSGGPGTVAARFAMSVLEYYVKPDETK
jgi:AhpD family alkylhydroperoxidase